MTANINQEVMAKIRRDGGPLVTVYCRDTRTGREYLLQDVPRNLSLLKIECRANFGEILKVEHSQ